MFKIVMTEGTPPIPVWLDVVDPTPEELFGLAGNYQLHPELVKDCLEPFHLPKLEQHGETTFIILRNYDDTSDPKDDSVQSMTRKLAIFIGDRFLISVHRIEEEFLKPFYAKYSKAEKPVILQVLLLEMLMAAVDTYHKPLEEMEARIHGFESAILQNQETLANWDDVFRTKCRLTIIKRILWHTLDTVQKFSPFSETNMPLRQNLCERIESLSFFADSLLDDLTALLDLQLSLATHRATQASNKTNEVMKVLTIFSAFFLPLNFIVGIYGMNFVHMPELNFRFGYLMVWGVLLSTVALIYSWFVRKGWIRWGHMS